METFADLVSRDGEMKEALINIEAWGLSARLNKTSVSVFAQNGLLLIELHDKPQLLIFAKEMGYISRPGAAGAAPDEPACSTIARLESELALERARRLKLAAELEAMEVQRKTRRLATGAADGRYVRLKNFLAKEFHPDNARGSAIERQMRAEFFKTVWAKVEDIDR